ncbi:MAG TPA: hypothetical protein VFA83_11015 [Acidimicrobiales bacterium]|nr:hypothetical protein [Acidimicrobiales bacterium]
MRRATALVLGLALTLAACGSKAEAKTIVHEASTKTADAHTARMALDIKIKAKSGAAPTEITGAGVFDLTKHAGTMDLKLPAFGGQNLGSIEVRILDKLVYEKLPAQLASLAGSKGWVKIDTEALAKQNGLDINGLAQSQGTDPSQFLDLLKSVSDDIKEVGKEKLRGAETTHYHGTVDLGKAIAANPQLDAEAKTNLGSLYKNLTGPADVWIDSDGRLRKMTYSIDASKFDPSAVSSNPKVAAGLQQIAGIDFTLELYQFGVPVSVTAPPANETTDLSSLTGGAGLG